MNSLALNQPAGKAIASRVFQYTLLTGLLASSGMPVFNNLGFFLGYCILCLIAAVVYKLKVNDFIYPSILFVIVLLLQVFYFGAFFINTAIMTALVIMTGLVCSGVLGTSFIKIFINIMVFLSIASLILFLPLLIKPDLVYAYIGAFPLHYEFLSETYGIEVTQHSFIFLNFPPDIFERIRNAGPFWEPGVWGGYLVIAFMLNTIWKNSIFNFSGLVLLLATASTFSTTAYISLLFFTGLYYIIKIKNTLLILFFLVTFMIGFFVVYNKIEFLGKKISQELTEVTFDANYQGGNSRMASAYLDLNEMKDNVFYIFAGRGVHPNTRVSTKDKNVQRNNGLTDMLSIWGLPLFLAFFYFMQKSITAVSRYYREAAIISYLFVFTIMSISFSEVYFQYGFVWSLIFLYPIFANKRESPGG